MKNGIVDGVYYVDDQPKHAGVIEIDGDIYYAGSGGKIAKGHKVVHSSMSNGILKHGTYKFDDDGKMVKDYYIKPEKVKHSKKKRKKRRKEPKFNIRDITAKQKKVVAVTALFIVLAVFLVVVVRIGDNTTYDTPSATDDKSSVNELRVTVPEFKDDVYLCSSSLERYYKGDMTLDKAMSTNASPYRGFVFDYYLRNADSATLEIDGKSYELDPSGSSITIDNLMTGKAYDYSVTVNGRDGNGNLKTEEFSGSFRTADTNRFVYLPGVENTRDVGGYKTEDGKTVAQGLLIRGSELDGLVVSRFFLTDKEAAADFGFKYDMDLRNSDVFYASYSSRLGDEVGHKFYTAPSYGEIFNKNRYAALREVFADLADSSKYPMYMHCTYGIDRTGTVVFLLQGVLGVSDEDKEIEYALSHGSNPDNLNVIYVGLEGTKGDTTNEKIVNYLIDTVGVKKEQIESIRKIFLEK